MVKCSTHGNCLCSHYWKLSFSKALFADSKQFLAEVCILLCALETAKTKEGI